MQILHLYSTFEQFCAKPPHYKPQCRSALTYNVTHYLLQGALKAAPYNLLLVAHQRF